ncbi:MAG: hypothetical protein GAK31_03470 [Stenotrophomonas maltophilia]|uniref:HPt domain-containing protein n=1 Tax=Stenotrophomonas maltophilia TaxID=40324 RepID=A0A7V8FDW9_STEMA|nr:MAG: hypothetical protein GAK31_03470 [Stenotrophomonas maltophilia]
MQQAWQQGDTATLQVTLHRLRGVLSMVGAPALAERLWALEQDTDAAALATGVDAVRDYLQRLQADAAQ